MLVSQGLANVEPAVSVAANAKSAILLRRETFVTRSETGPTSGLFRKAGHDR